MGYTWVIHQLPVTSSHHSDLRIDGDAETPPELRAQQLAAGEVWQSRENQAMGAAWRPSESGRVMEKCISYYK